MTDRQLNQFCLTCVLFWSLATGIAWLVANYNAPEIKGYRYSTEMVVTGIGETGTSADGIAWTELKFEQKPTTATPLR